MARPRTRIETRTLAFFIVCALVPVAVFALVGYVMVQRQLTALTTDQMNAAAKSYGLALYDRLGNVDRQLSVLAQRYLDGDLTASAIENFSDQRARIRVVPQAPGNSPTAAHPQKRLQVVNEDGHRVALEVLASNGSASVRLSALLRDEYLWNTDSLLIREATICVTDSQGVPLHCADATERSSAAPGVFGDWTLFLKGVYDSPPWLIRTAAPTLSSNASFRWLLPASAALAVAIALLAGSIFIRRSHAPLRLLADMARRIGRRRFERPIRIDSGDEYGRLARAFNRTARRLDDQFDLLGLLAQLDLAILARSGIAPAVQAVLPKLPGLLKCRAVAIVLHEDAAAMSLVLRGRSDIQKSVLAPEAISLLACKDAGMHTCACDPGAQPFGDFARLAIESVLVQPVVVEGKVRAHLIVSNEGAQQRFMARRLHDISQRLAVAFANADHERQLRRQAYFDSLTGLANRAMLHEWLATNVLNADGRISKAAVVFVDLDRFKSVNDSLGHSLGDSLLRQVAERLQRKLPTGALLSRFGGDEFVIVLPQADRAAVREFAAALLDSLREPCALEHVRYVAQASLGIAMFPDDGTSVDVLLRNADIALYRAKAGGRGRFCFFDESMSRMAADRLHLEERLRGAIREGGIVAHYQPKVNGEGEVIGVEALARWLPPGEEPISPARFVPLAEETGLIVPMGEALLHEICSSIRNWRQRGLETGPVAVNISMIQLRDPAFAAKILQCLAQYGLEGGAIEVELTESVFAEDHQAIARQLRQLADAGMRIAIDDFGTGFSSMSLLRHFPIRSIKIDRSFVVDSTRSRESRLLLGGLIEIGHAMTLDVVAEGVETAEQFELLQELRCDVFQGYLFSRALSAVELEAFIADRRTAAIA